MPRTGMNWLHMVVYATSPAQQLSSPSSSRRRQKELSDIRCMLIAATGSGPLNGS